MPNMLLRAETRVQTRRGRGRGRAGSRRMRTSRGPSPCGPSGGGAACAVHENVSAWVLVCALAYSVEVSRARPHPFWMSYRLRKTHGFDSERLCGGVARAVSRGENGRRLTSRSCRCERHGRKHAQGGQAVRTRPMSRRSA
jgi:hypothetical protein